MMGRWLWYEFGSFDHGGKYFNPVQCQSDSCAKLPKGAMAGLHYGHLTGAGARRGMHVKVLAPMFKSLNFAVETYRGVFNCR